MPAVYEFRCTGCDTRWEENRHDYYHPSAKHLREGEPCGRIVRVWGGRVNIANLKAARG